MSPAHDTTRPEDVPKLHPGAGAPPPEIPRHRFAIPRQRLGFYPRLLRFEDHPTAWTFPAYLDERVPWVAVLKELYTASPLTFPASMSPEAGLFLHALVRNLRPRTVVEVGTYIGVSTIWMASALQAAEGDPPQAPVEPGQAHGVIHCFDDFTPIQPAPWRKEHRHGRPRRELVLDHLARAGLAARVVLHQGDSSVQIRRAWPELRRWPGEAPPAAGARTGGVDLALIDGDHSIPGALQDLWAVEPVLNTGGYVVLHDIHPDQCGDHLGPRHILEHILEVAQGLYELCEVHTAPLNYGMAVLRRVG